MAENSDLSTLTESFKEIQIRTYYNKKYYRIEWIIEKFSEFVEKLESVRFCTIDKQSWSLVIYPYGDNQQSRGFVSVFLKPHFKDSISTNVWLFLLDSKRNKTFSKNFKCTYSGEEHGNSQFINRDVLFGDKNKLLLNNNLTVLCELEVVENVKHELSEKCLKESEENFLVDDFVKILGDSDLSDVTMSVGEKDFKLHKVILAARSPVFAAMFKHPMEEAKTNSVKIPGVLPEVMEEVIKYIYTGKSPNLNLMAEDMLPVADKYDLEGLKEMCAKQLHIQLSVQNAAVILELADIYNLAALKEKVTNFIGKHVNEVVASAGWTELTTLNSKLAVGTLSAIIKEVQSTQKLSTDMKLSQPSPLNAFPRPMFGLPHEFNNVPRESIPGFSFK